MEAANWRLIKHMNREEFQTLKAYAIARRNAPRARLQGRRHVKGKAKGLGQWLKNSRIIPVSVDFLAPMQEAGSRSVVIKHVTK